ncbi:MAG: carboxypeptidase regulatory-like domain-containing protein, partial [Candidatus Zixiibacteriota bacterium]
MRHTVSASTPLFLALISLAFVCGCFSGSSSGGTISNPVPVGTITGRVTASDSIALSVTTPASVRPEVKVPQATVWLLNDFNVTATTDADGNFSLSPVPYGNQRVVAKVVRADGKAFKIRSGEIPISSEDPKDAGTVELEQANNRVQGVLLDSKGNPVANATLYLWGEPFTTDAFGRFSSPTLPDSTPVEEITMAPVVGLATQSIVAPFTPQGEAIIISTLCSHGDTKRPPHVWLTSKTTGGDKVAPGERVTLWAVYYDLDVNDRSSLSESWRLTGGSLASATTPFPDDLKRRVRELSGNIDVESVTFAAVEWTAPAEPGHYKIQIEVKDQSSAVGKAQYIINTGNSAPLNRTPQAVISVPSVVIVGQPLRLEVIAEDADLDLLTFKWSVAPNAGSLSAIGSTVATWTAPTATGTYTVQCQVQEAQQGGLSVTPSVTVQVVASPIEVSKGRIAGHVLDEYTNLPISGALVNISGTSITTITDSTGFFEFSGLQPGTYTL